MFEVGHSRPSNRGLSQILSAVYRGALARMASSVTAKQIAMPFMQLRCGLNPKNHKKHNENNGWRPHPRKRALGGALAHV